MGIDAEGYARMLRALLPRGPAWSTDGSSVLQDVLLAIGDEFARIHAACERLLREMDPRTTVEMLVDWERVLGLPDPCVDVVQTLQQRRDNVLVKLTMQGGASKQFFIDIAAQLGYTITITEPDDYTWQVNAPETTIRYFRCGQSGTGEALRTWGNKVLECAIEHRAPAHTVVLFAYGA